LASTGSWPLEIDMTELSDLQNRVRSLETRQRRLRAWCGGTSVLWIVSCMAAVAAPNRDELRARRFVLVDEQGLERGRLATDPDGAALVLESRDEQAHVRLVASKATWTERHSVVSFTTSPDVVMPELEPEETQHEGPWCGMIAWTGNEKTPDMVTSMGAGDHGGISTARGNCRIDLAAGGEQQAAIQMEYAKDGAASKAYLVVDENGSGLYCEAGDDPWGNVHLLATAKGSGITGSWNDRNNLALVTSEAEVALSLSQEHEDEDSEGPPEVELRAVDAAGSITLRRGTQESFHAPH